MKQKFDLTKSEYEIMTILWNSDIPLAKYQILDKSDEYKWNDNYLKKMLTGLLKKGAIKPVGEVKVATKNSRLYVPTMTEEEYCISKYPIHSVKVIAGLVDDIYKKSDKNEKDELINELEQMVEDLKEKNQ